MEKIKEILLDVIISLVIFIIGINMIEVQESELYSIEKVLTQSIWDNKTSSYFIRDPLINKKTVVNVYIKRIYKDSTKPYYLPFSDWTRLKGIKDSRCLIADKQVQFYDPENKFRGQEVIVTLAVNTEYNIYLDIFVHRFPIGKAAINIAI
ncbi:MAG: hypothetical protein OXI58_20855 [Gemmatimonadota bacterium]|nr:hypothetical protein [Gemmatimonadota bacterium]